MIRQITFALILSFIAATGFGQSAEEPAKLPKVVLIGDSIRMSYAPLVSERLEGSARVISSKSNGGDSSNVLKHLDAWVIAEQPTLVHLNCGIHDTKKFSEPDRFQISPEDYEANLRKIIARIRAETDAVVVLATSTPVLDERAKSLRQGRNYVLLDSSIVQYNAILRKVAKELNVPINDLHHLLAQPMPPHKTTDLIGDDGVHLTLAGRKLLGERVSETIEKNLVPKQENAEAATPR